MQTCSRTFTTAVNTCLHELTAADPARALRQASALSLLPRRPRWHSSSSSASCAASPRKHTRNCPNALVRSSERDKRTCRPWPRQRSRAACPRYTAVTTRTPRSAPSTCSVEPAKNLEWRKVDCPERFCRALPSSADAELCLAASWHGPPTTRSTRLSLTSDPLRRPARFGSHSRNLLVGEAMSETFGGATLSVRTVPTYPSATVRFKSWLRVDLCACMRLQPALRVAVELDVQHSMLTYSTGQCCSSSLVCRTPTGSGRGSRPVAITTAKRN